MARNKNELKTVGREEAVVSPGRERVQGPLSCVEVAALLGITPRAVWITEQRALRRLLSQRGGELIAFINDMGRSTKPQIDTTPVKRFSVMDSISELAKAGFSDREIFDRTGASYSYVKRIANETRPRKHDRKAITKPDSSDLRNAA